MTNTRRHACDADCTVDRFTSECRVCLAFHGQPCHHCGARAYHRDDCPYMRGVLAMERIGLAEAFAEAEQLDMGDLIALPPRPAPAEPFFDVEGGYGHLDIRADAIERFAELGGERFP